ncbi:LOW QUALITY PROTEIN: homeobox protein Hox-B8a [Kryptolebias marmoratus]|uniref:LOW QUALITY PROTEIN: homeobox protein Hox-B8a n=1 Tax=Kryptolebias marmoratus TaxID=37003 RepID=UPI0018ACBE2B|nr:LOW QUALITY PROTEIN: homeobox protein Hox-B8a [Kryptolebias marmoratus]
MSSYFVNSLFSKYKSGDSLRPNYYECGFAQDLAGSRPTVVYGPGSGATFQHAPQIQDFYHHGASSLPSNPYQQSPCAVTCHGEPGNFYGYDALQRQTLFGAQDADLVQYSDCKLGGATGLGGEDTDGTEQSPSPTQLFPWMRPQGEETGNSGRDFRYVWFQNRRMKWKKENNKDKFPSSKSEQEAVERERREKELGESGGGSGGGSGEGGGGVGAVGSQGPVSDDCCEKTHKQV